MESANTTSSGTLFLFSGNYDSDPYALIRILYEITSIMHYGNKSKANQIEIYDTFYSIADEQEQNRVEWQMTKKSTNIFENDYPELKEVHRELNNMGSHISFAKIRAHFTQVHIKHIEDTLKHIEESAASRIFTLNFHYTYYLMGFDMLHSIFLK